MRDPNHLLAPSSEHLLASLPVKRHCHPGKSDPLKEAYITDASLIRDTQTGKAWGKVLLPV